MAKGLFITLEGSEGSGKSTQIEVIKNYLLSRGHKVECVREPGGTPIAEDIRALLKEIREDDRLCDKAELLLMYAARAQLVQTFIKPNLKAVLILSVTVMIYPLLPIRAVEDR